MKKIFSGLIAMITLFSLFSCAYLFGGENDANKEINTITDFSKYANMTRETDKIEVTFDNYTGKPFCFTIEDKQDIDEIMNIVFSASFVNRGNELFAGDNTSITIIQGDAKYTLGVNGSREGKNFYAFSTQELHGKIRELARKAGAYYAVE